LNLSERSTGTLLVWLAAAVLGTLAIVRLIEGDGAPAAPPLRIDRSPAAAGGAAPGPGGGSGVYVHVAGAVRRPGLVGLPAGSRVARAVARAGGPTRAADLTAVNLAARLEDGQQVVVPTRGAAAPPAPGPGVAGAAKLSLSTATVEQLDELDGIGPTLAQRIVDYRTENGGFRSLDELRDVDGIGEKRFATLREALQP
jgi:competence protein ComEA